MWQTHEHMRDTHCVQSKEGKRFLPFCCLEETLPPKRNELDMPKMKNIKYVLQRYIFMSVNCFSAVWVQPKSHTDSIYKLTAIVASCTQGVSQTLVLPQSSQVSLTSTLSVRARLGL